MVACQNHQPPLFFVLNIVCFLFFLTKVTHHSSGLIGQLNFISTSVSDYCQKRLCVCKSLLRLEMVNNVSNL